MQGSSGAWVGARVARAGVESWFCGCVQEGTAFEPESLRAHLHLLLDRMRPAGRSKVVGTMRHDLPTTMAVVRYRLSGDQVSCQALWAGDSRVYSLTPSGGLQALTRDHTVETDALEQLLQDPPLTNVLCADQDFVVDSNDMVRDLPCVLVTATDGFFGYVDTPAHFECHVLGTLRRAASETDWAMRLASQVSSYTGDDASISITALGYSGFEQLQESFGTRTNALLARYGRNPPDARHGRKALQQWRTETWHEYRPGYERCMPSSSEEQA